MSLLWGMGYLSFTALIRHVVVKVCRIWWCGSRGDSLLEVGVHFPILYFGSTRSTRSTSEVLEVYSKYSKYIRSTRSIFEVLEVHSKYIRSSLKNVKYFEKYSKYIGNNRLTSCMFIVDARF